MSIKRKSANVQTANNRSTKPPFAGLPTSVTIFNQRWHVKYVSPVSKEEVLLGAADASERTIYLDREMDEEAIRSTLVHEMLHAYIEQSAIRPIINAQEVLDAEEFEELLVLWAEVACVDMMRNNDFIKKRPSR